MCTTSLKMAKKMALEQKSLIYTNKNQLPEWVSEVGGFCGATLRRPNGKFARKFCKKFFNNDIKLVDTEKN